MLSVALSDRDVLYKENVQLKARLGRTGEVRRIVAGVLLRPPATPYDTLVIDAGTAEGVTLQAVVSAGGSVVLGTVFEVYEHSSRVRLYSAPGESYDALLQYGKNTEHIALVLKGQGGGSMHAEVPSGISVTVGDKAFLPGLAGGLSAVVTSIDQNEGASFTTVHFTLPVNLYTLRYIEVWKQPSYDTR
jgi:cell shape-determining protein MreC